MAISIVVSYFILAALWLSFVTVHQRGRYQRKRPYLVDTIMEHFVLFPVGFFLYLKSGLLFSAGDK